MGVARWRLVLVPMMIVVAGCLAHPPQVASDLPSSFLSAFGPMPPTFTILPPPVGATGQEIVADLRAMDDGPMFDGRAVPLFIGIECHGNPPCSTTGNGPFGGSGTYWLVLYPDCTGPDGDIGWVLLDGVKGVDGGGSENTAPCPRHQ